MPRVKVRGYTRIYKGKKIRVHGYTREPPGWKKYRRKRTYRRRK